MAENVSGRLVSFDIPDARISVIGSEDRKVRWALELSAFLIALLLAAPPFVAVYQSMTAQVPQGEVVQTDASDSFILD